MTEDSAGLATGVGSLGGSTGRQITGLPPGPGVVITLAFVPPPLLLPSNS